MTFPWRVKTEHNTVAKANAHPFWPARSLPFACTWRGRPLTGGRAQSPGFGLRTSHGNLGHRAFFHLPLNSLTLAKRYTQLQVYL